MTALSIVLPLLGFVAVAVGGRALALHFRRRGHGAALDAMELWARRIELKILRGKAVVLRSIRLPKRRARRDAAPFD